MKIKLFCTLMFGLLPLFGLCQEYSSSFNAVRMPVSSHTAALGGVNVSLIEADPTVGWANPALYANADDLSFGLNFMTYHAGSSWMGAHFTKAFGERHTMAAGIQYMNYGSFDETDETGQVTGEFKAKDIIVGTGYSYLFSDRWTGGANLKFIYSGLADYSSMALAVDLGLNYYDEEGDLSLSLAAQNIGTQLKAYDGGIRTHLPFTLAFGFTKGMAHLPIRLHITLTDLTRWKSSYFALPDDKTNEYGEKKDDLSFTKKFLNHLVVGIDVLPTDYLYFSLGYNFRRAYELKASGSSHMAGLSIGGGLTLKRFKFGATFARYHQAGNSLMFNAGYTL